MTGDSGLGGILSADTGTAGRSARRHGTRLRPAPTAAPAPLADLLGPLTPSPSPAASRWNQGAAGEQLTARLLAPLTHLGWVVLHDRRIPCSAANLDHLLIGGETVWVIDTKAWQGRTKLLGDGRLWYGRTPLDPILATVRWQAHAVADHLERCLGRPVITRPVLCIHGVRLPTDPLPFDDVTLVTGPRLLRLLSTDQVVAPSDEDAERLATAASEIFPSR